MDKPTNKPADRRERRGYARDISAEQRGNGTFPSRASAARKPYDQEFFLTLARRGKEVWNRWRAENHYVEGHPYISVTFEGVDFRDPPNAIFDFSGFDFGDGANFRACKFVDVPSLRSRAGKYSPGMAKFNGAAFGNDADLSGATFGDWAKFSGATFAAVSTPEQNYVSRPE